MVLKTEESKHPPTKICDKFLQVLEILQSANKTLIIIPYKSINYFTGAIVKPHSMPTKIMQIGKYLDGVVPKEKGGEMYIKILMAHNRNFSDICEDTQYEFKEGGHKIYKRQLPVEKMESMGHFLFSVCTQDMEDLKNVLWEELHLDVALRWRIMQTKETYVKYNDKDNAPSAIQILVSSKEVEVAQQILQSVYLTKKGGYLDGQKMRYILDCKLLVSSEKKAKLQDAALQQLAFNKAIKPLYSNAVYTLNKKFKNTDQTLREIILQLPSKYNNKSMIFHSVDKTWNNPTRTVFTCIPQNLKKQSYIQLKSE